MKALWLTGLAVVAMAGTTLLVLVLRTDRLKVSEARTAIEHDVRSARVTDGPRVNGAKVLKMRIAQRGQAADARSALLAAERQLGRGWDEAVSCKNYAVTYRFAHPDPDGRALALALPVEGAVRRATPNGERDCQG